MFAPAEGVATHRHFDSRLGRDIIKLLPNEYYVTSEEVILSTVLGSCVAACIRDPLVQIGGMNHFMLPGTDDSGTGGLSMRYGAHAMEVLINELLKAGARRERLEAKVFGGGAVIDRLRQLNIGERNAEFVLDYLATEQIPVVAQDLCGEHARRINFMPRTGQVMVKRMATPNRDTVVGKREQALRERMRELLPKPKVELFTATPKPKVEMFRSPAVELFNPASKEYP